MRIVFFSNKRILEELTMIKACYLMVFLGIALSTIAFILRTAMNQSIAKKDLLSISLAIFCLLFGAGNLIFPLTVGRAAGELTVFGMIGFFITAIFLPLAGLIGMILFDGDYIQFFNRLGKLPGSIITFTSMLIIGPMIVIPRCITLSHTMLAPFLPIDFLKHITIFSSFVFCLCFLSIAFLATYRKNKIVSILGNIIAPILLASVALIIGKGISTDHTLSETTLTRLAIFKSGFMMGYQTLDLLGTIFFASIIINILKKTTPQKDDLFYLAINGLKAGLIGLSLLGSIYIGMSILGAFYGPSFENADAGELLQLISVAILGSRGAAIIGISILLACISTTIGLGSVVADYTRKTIFNNSISYIQSLLLIFISCVPLSTFGLKYVLAITGGPIIHIGYPVLISLTLCNIIYKIWGFKYIKLPVAATFVIACISYLIT